MKKKFDDTNLICPYCKYQNLQKNYKVYGTCTRCGKIIDSKAKYKYEMNKKLRLWKGKLR